MLLNGFGKLDCTLNCVGRIRVWWEYIRHQVCHEDARFVVGQFLYSAVHTAWCCDIWLFTQHLVRTSVTCRSLFTNWMQISKWGENAEAFIWNFISLASVKREQHWASFVLCTWNAFPHLWFDRTFLSRAGITLSCRFTDSWQQTSTWVILWRCNPPLLRLLLRC